MGEYYDEAMADRAVKVMADNAFRVRSDLALMGRVLDAVAPLIAAKALRDAAADVLDTRGERKWLTDRADEIERGRS